MAYKLLQSAAKSWRRVNAPHLVAAVIAGIEFEDGARVKKDPPDLQPDAQGGPPRVAA
jgi:hypothetical protein